jgi:hypothetical protein
MPHLPGKEHIPQRDLLLPAGPAHITARPRPRRLPHKRILLLATTIPALCLDEQAVAVVGAQTARVLEQDVCFALAHFAQDDDEVGVLFTKFTISN